MEKENCYKKLIEKSINKLNFERKKHILLIDDHEILNENDFINLLQNFYTKKIFEENTKIHIKLKINLDEFLVLNNMLKPTLSLYE